MHQHVEELTKMHQSAMMEGEKLGSKRSDLSNGLNLLLNSKDLNKD